MGFHGTGVGSMERPLRFHGFHVPLALERKGFLNGRWIHGMSYARAMDLDDDLLMAVITASLGRETTSSKSTTTPRAANSRRGGLTVTDDDVHGDNMTPNHHSDEELEQMLIGAPEAPTDTSVSSAFGEMRRSLTSEPSPASCWSIG